MEGDYSFLTDTTSSVDTTAAPSSTLSGASSGINWDTALSKALDTYLATETLDAKTQMASQPAGYYRVPGTQSVLPAGQTAVNSSTMTLLLVAAGLLVGGIVLFKVMK